MRSIKHLIGLHSAFYKQILPTLNTVYSLINLFEIGLKLPTLNTNMKKNRKNYTLNSPYYTFIDLFFKLSITIKQQSSKIQ